MSIVLITALFALILAFVLGLALGFFKQFFAVEEDARTAEIRALLPGANCGACGFPGCDGYAAAVAEGSAGINSCPVGGQSVVEQLAALIGGDADHKPMVAFLACRGTADKARLRGNYIGVKSCRAAKISAGSVKSCSWGCQSLGDCVKVCKFDALVMGEDGLPRIDTGHCTGCKACVTECPQRIIRLVPANQKGAYVLCSNSNANKAMVSKSCKAGCIKCELCVKNCPGGCITMQKGIPMVDYGKCTSCGTCVSKCPTKVIKLLEKDILHITSGPQDRV